MIKTNGMASCRYAAARPDGHLCSWFIKGFDTPDLSDAKAVIGGTSSTIMFVVAGTSLGYVALAFGPGELLAVGVFGLAIGAYAYAN